MAKMWRRCIALMVAATFAATLLSCGDATSAGQQTPASDGAARPGVSKAEIDASSPGTPERAVLEWWRYVQLNDPASARAFYLDPPDLADLAGQFNFLGDRVDGEVKVVASDVAGRTAQVEVRWSRQRHDIRRLRLHLQRQNDAWKLVDARFLDEMVAELQR